MTQEEILQYNQRCAEFLGLKRGWWISQKKPLTDDKKQWWDIDGKTFLGTRVYFDKDLVFHSDWNWIMELKEKICQLDIVDEFNTYYDSVAKGFNCSILPSYRNTFDSFCTKVLTNEKEAVVQAINQFLIWYEQNKTI